MAPESFDDYSDLVASPDDACPDCGENRIDWLAWDENGEFVTCTSCGCVYVPWEEGVMFGLLRPTTLAVIIADLQNAEDNAWMKLNERLYLDDATTALVDLVGPEDADKLITEAEEELP
jgi:predicted RNA-binding Zn-ribbon protein involved in translation (DUF1610 family)